MPKIKKKLSVCFRDVPEDVIDELSRRHKLAGLVAAAFANYVNHSDEGRFALAAATGGVNQFAPPKRLPAEIEPRIKRADNGSAASDESASVKEAEVVKRTANSLLFKNGKS